MCQFPLVTRRFNLFKMRPSRNKLFTDFTKKLHKAGDECNVRREEGIYVMLYLNAVKGNAKLSEELHKVVDPTPEKLHAAAEAWEIAQTHQYITNNPKAHSATLQNQRKAKVKTLLKFLSTTLSHPTRNLKLRTSVML